MTTEKMTVHKALCELKTLDSRIQKCMQQNPFVFANKHANSKVAGVSVGDYCKEVQASYQPQTTSLPAVMLLSVRSRCPTPPSR